MDPLDDNPRSFRHIPRTHFGGGVDAKKILPGSAEMDTWSKPEHL